jgi:hypothetical protein
VCHVLPPAIQAKALPSQFIGTARAMLDRRDVSAAIAGTVFLLLKGFQLWQGQNLMVRFRHQLEYLQIDDEEADTLPY